MIDVHPMRDGFALRLDLGDPLQRAMAAQRRYESDVTWVYPYLLRPGDRVVDGGAHIGYLTLLASRCVGPSGEVHAFEPVPRTFAALGENVRLNHATNIRTNRVALGARAGELELEVPIDPEGEGLLAWGATSVRLRRGPIERAPAMTLDEYARGYGFARIALLKLDLEGAELAALGGSLVRLLRWWLLSALERQDHVNRLLVRAIEQLDERSPRAVDERLTAIEETWRTRDSAERAELLESTALTQAFASTDRFQGADPAPVVEVLRGRTRLLVSDLSWPGLANALHEASITYQGVDPDAASVARSRAAGADAVQRNTDVQLRALADGSLDGAVLMGSPLQVSLGHVVILFRQLRRTLAPGAPFVVVVPNTESLRVGASVVWCDPGARRPVPPSLYAEIVQLAGFAKPEVRTLRGAGTSLAEDVGDPKLAANMRVLNELLFGPEISAVIARK